MMKLVFKILNLDAEKINIIVFIQQNMKFV